MRWILPLVFGLLVVGGETTSAQSRDQGRVYKTTVSPKWSPDGAWMWYRNRLPGGRFEHIRVELQKGVREPAFSHERVAEALSKTSGMTIAPDRLEIDVVRLQPEQGRCVFTWRGAAWECDVAAGEVREIEYDPPKLRGRRSRGSAGAEMRMTIVNRTGRPLELFWVEGAAARRSYGKIASGSQVEQHTFDGHRWELRDAQGALWKRFRADASEPLVVAEGDKPLASPSSPRASERGARSPDGKASVLSEHHNLFLVSEDQRLPLTTDGDEQCEYRFAGWSSDSAAIAAWRVRPTEFPLTHRLESSPKGGGRARLHSRPYALPGDPMTTYELCLFDAETAKSRTCETDIVDFGRPRLRWSQDGSKLWYQQVDRGHQRFRLIEVDARSGQHRAVIDERSDTFIWTAHMEQMGGPLVRWLSDEKVLYSSEQDGWRRIYLVDVASGRQSPITPERMVVRGVERIDSDARRLWFRACGGNQEQDPYHIHFYRIDWDGSGLVRLTHGDGDHRLEYSPDQRFYVDQFSRADLPPVHELRRSSDGELICKLEEADASEWLATGRSLPEVFRAKGRDGAVDIWGLIHRPANCDPNKKHPVIEYIYAGPHGAHVPKRFSTRSRFRDLTDLGFIVVQIDGMGTAHRGKAFHDVCWKNLKDAGFPDRIAWMRAAAAQYPEMDLTRVGIFGGSAGGQNAVAALLFHPDFYQAAVANCGCHDNRMDKASWNEQWMGYPVDQAYSESSNIDNAGKLQGRLMLIVGEMDTNVPPESTLRLADALIKADKDFDLLFVPGGGHGAGGAYGRRRQREFFQTHLMGVALPNHNQHTDEVDQSDPATDDGVAAAAVLAAQGSGDAAERLTSRYRADLRDLTRFYPDPVFPIASQRLLDFYSDWLVELDDLLASESADVRPHREAISKFREEVRESLSEALVDSRRRAHIAPLTPFAAAVAELIESKLRVDRMAPREAAGRVQAIADSLNKLCEQLDADGGGDELRDWKPDAYRKAADVTSRLATSLANWRTFYAGYDPLFTWWVKAPYEECEKAFERYGQCLRTLADRSDSDSHAKAHKEHVGDPPSLRQLLTDEPGRMRGVVLHYGKEFPSRRRRRANAAETASRLAQFSESLQALPFDGFNTFERVDYLLLRNHVDRRIARLRDPNRDARKEVLDDSGIPGRPIGEQALARELRSEMIPYSAAELIEIAELEYAWCRKELKRAAREMGFGDDWRQAIEHVKGLHREPGEQPYLIRDLARESIDFLRKHDLVSVPPLAVETWGMRMMTPERQRVNPFFTGGSEISVSFPTDSMTHQEKLQSLRGNNEPFSRATVQHELIPGHNLQAFVYARNRPYRRMFATPFWGEGWALYWEMRLYELGFPKTPEDRVGFLVWRSHRCARIVFSLSFHLGRMTPGQCVDYLVANVGFERKNSEAEVRRSFATNYGPLYQAAYMVGGLQFRALHRELVVEGDMSERDFHDAVLRHNSIPVELTRASLRELPLARDHAAQWRFYQPPPGVSPSDNP